jgi:hypothetical protein
MMMMKIYVSHDKMDFLSNKIDVLQVVWQVVAMTWQFYSYKREFCK